jgi:hypothetical protein
MLSTQNENQNLSNRLVRIVQNDAEDLTRGTIKSLQTNPKTKSYQTLPYEDLHSRVYEVYHDLGRWLSRESDDAMQAWYVDLGEKRCSESIPLAEVLWAQVLTKYRLLDYLAAYASAGSAMELYQQQEFDRLIGQFFDRAVCYTAQGYEQQASSPARKHREAAPPVHWRFP